MSGIPQLHGSVLGALMFYYGIGDGYIMHHQVAYNVYSKILMFGLSVSNYHFR